MSEKLCHLASHIRSPLGAILYCRAMNTLLPSESRHYGHAGCFIITSAYRPPARRARTPSLEHDTRRRFSAQALMESPTRRRSDLCTTESLFCQAGFRYGRRWPRNRARASFFVRAFTHRDVKGINLVEDGKAKAGLVFIRVDHPDLNGG